MNSSTKLNTDYQNLVQRRETIEKERQAVSESLKTSTQSVIQGTHSVNEVTNQKLLLETYNEALRELNEQIEAIETKLTEARQIEARNSKIRRVLAIDANAEAKQKELQKLISDHEASTDAFNAKRLQLLGEIGNDISEFNRIGEQLINGLVKHRSGQYVENIEASINSFFAEIKEKGGKLKTLRSGSAVGRPREALNSNESFQTVPTR